MKKWLVILIVLLIKSYPFTLPDTLVLSMAGDFMIGSWGMEEIEKNGIEYPIKNLKDLFSRSDFNMCNLEAPFTESDDMFPQKIYTFKVKPELADILTLLPVHYVTLANNHIMDFGRQGLQETIGILKKNKIAFSGAGMTEQEAIRPAIITVKGKKIGVVASGAIFPEEFWATDTSAGVFFPWKEKLVDVLESTRSEVDYLVATFHWGAEKRETPKEYQQGLAHLCINHGADLVWGHHPHVIQGVEWYKGKPVFYSLGNFIFASFSTTATGMIAQVVYIDGELDHLRVIPLNINNFEKPIQPSLYNNREKYDFINRVNVLSDSLGIRPVSFDSSGVWMTNNIE